MAIATITGNVVNLGVEGATPLQLTMSLQRHSYRHCANSASGALNSLFHSTVDDVTFVAEAVEVGEMIEELLLKAGGKWASLFGKTLTVGSRRTYLVDNSSLNPNGSPNHFFVTGGDGVWAKIPQFDYVAARDVRRVEEAIATRQERKDKYDYLDPKKFAAKQAESGGRDNPVVVAVVAARVSLGQASSDDKALIAASGRKDIVDLLRNR
ncbi:MULTISPECIES: hypothetical protein [unclassified Streptomyces]|uniref:hypothetical protein n=1 Tax=unclassified Streptomyces TaxID=2593676 RepID=UPI0004C82DAD|nr:MULTISPECIES: hypothetical protein [unclassified Streptomyces]KJY16149.1 hypothetical protein VR43_35680 [Streptomyces sp. NRRL S-104]